MTLAPRRQPAALLQVNAILGRLDGKSALDEIARYLQEEFPELAAVTFYRTDPAPRAMAGGTAPDGPEPPEGLTDVDQAARTAAPVEGSEGRAVALPVRDAEAIVGVLHARSARGPFDAVDRRFLTEVARRSAAAVTAGPRRLL